jgi:hypothetical protein
MQRTGSELALAGPRQLHIAGDWQAAPSAKQIEWLRREGFIRVLFSILLHISHQ